MLFSTINDEKFKSYVHKYYLFKSSEIGMKYF